MVVSKLVYGEQIIGFRFSRIPFKKGILADMYYDVGKEVLDKIPDCDIERGICEYFGDDVPVKLINGRYISNNEQDAVEVLSYDEWVGFLYCNQTVVANVYKRSGIEGRPDKGEINEGRSYFFNGKSHFFDWSYLGVNIEGHPKNIIVVQEEDCTNIVQLEDHIRVISNIAICNMHCSIQVMKHQIDADIFVSFPNLLEFSKFIHEWYKYKSSLSIVIKGKKNFSVNSVNNVKAIYDKLKSITHSKDGYIYPGSDWKDCGYWRDRPYDTIEEFSFRPNYYNGGIYASTSTQVYPIGYDEVPDWY